MVLLLWRWYCGVGAGALVLVVLVVLVLVLLALVVQEEGSGALVRILLHHLGSETLKNSIQICAAHALHGKGGACFKWGAAKIFAALQSVHLTSSWGTRLAQFRQVPKCQHLLRTDLCRSLKDKSM